MCYDRADFEREQDNDSWAHDQEQQGQLHKEGIAFYCLGEPDMDWEYFQYKEGKSYFKNIETGDFITIKGDPIDLEIGTRVKIDYFPE
ncbi:hypothetical protein Q4E40_02735 [Pontibacter sp. BT731]|uniref:hypothetical protein n=1 Tax=Pontibacter coccineus TaxID=3063328 RepID=UPI0026E19280|nr:hypothetical protein [Pontibacter sp. BT731]MDO6389029.1 hypothetical protein [Pontibacter sp. BT731]